MPVFGEAPFEGVLTLMGQHLASLTYALDQLRAEHRAELLSATRSLRERNRELMNRLRDATGGTVNLQEFAEEEPKPPSKAERAALLRQPFAAHFSQMFAPPQRVWPQQGGPFAVHPQEPAGVEHHNGYPPCDVLVVAPSLGMPRIDVGKANHPNFGSVTTITSTALGTVTQASTRASSVDTVTGVTRLSVHGEDLLEGEGRREVKSRRASQFADGGRQNVELEKVWERPRPLQERTQRRFSNGGDKYNFDVFANANFTNVMPRSKFTDELSNSVLQKAVMEPSSGFSMLWNLMEVFLLCYDMVVIPVQISGLDPPATVVSFSMQVVSIIFWSVDIPLTFFKGFVTRSGDLEMRLGYIAVHYAKTRLIYDLTLASIEWVNFSITTMFTTNYASSGRALRLVRFSRLLKVGKLQRLMQVLSQRIRSNVVLTMLSMSKVVIFIIMTCHFGACGMFAAFTADDSEGESVIGGYSTFGKRYTSAFHWSLSELGFGASDIFPQTIIERVYATAFAVISMMLLVFLIGSVVTGMTRLQMLLKVQREQEEQLRDYLSRHRVSWPLRNRVWIFLRKHTKTEKKHVLESNVELIKKLPKAMTFELRAEVFIPILTVHPFFGTYAVSSADKFAMHTLVEKYAVLEFALDTEHELFIEGEQASSMFFLVQGTLVYRIGQGANRQAPAADRTGWDGNEAGDDSVLLGPGEWLCEEALWLKWSYVGSAVAKTHCEVVSLSAEKFQNIMYQHLPQAQKYARSFLQYAKDHIDCLNDSWVDLTCLRSMAHDIFEPPIAFDVKSCQPVTDMVGRNDWRPSNRRQWQRIWTTPWKEAHYLNRSALLSTMTTDMKHDAIMVYQTLFSQHHPELLGPTSWVSPEDQAAHDLRVMFLKRLILCFATCRLAFTTENNGQRNQSWPFPLGSVICHGSRILLRLTGVPWRDFINYLLFGETDHWNWEESGTPSPFYVRRAASHGVRLDTRTSELQECKLKNLQAFSNNHLGMDIPVGGIGNPAPTHKLGNLFVGPGGMPFRKARRRQGAEYVREIQHGHLYVRWDDFGAKTAPVLLPKEMVGRRPNDTTVVDREASVPAPHAVGRVRSKSLSASEPVTELSKSNSGQTRVSVLDYGSQTEWSPVHHLRTTEDLESVLRLHGAGGSEAATSEEALSRLFQLVARTQELSLELSKQGRLRCHGVLVHLVVVFAAAEDDLPSNRRVLVHSSATGGTSSTTTAAEHAKEDLQDPTASRGGSSTTSTNSSHVRLTDKRVLTVLCCHHESWTAAVSRYCQQVLHLPDAAVDRLLDGCYEESDETFNFRCPASPTICHHHEVACQGEELPLVYESLRLKTRLFERDRHLFGGFLQPTFVTTETAAELHGFGGRAPEIGTITREWRWMKMDEAMAQDVVGLRRPEEACGLYLTRETRRLCSLLIGIESSAPLKEDLFGNTHGVDAKSKDRSAFGKPKWRAYGKGGQEVPADLGGTKVNINEHTFAYFQEVCRIVGVSAPTKQGLQTEEQLQEQALFRDLLSDNDEGVEKILNDFLEEKAPMMKPAPEVSMSDHTVLLSSLSSNLFSM